MNDFEIFSQLHYNAKPLVIGNAWDVASAKTYEENGFKAVATSSAAIADSLGYQDGQNMPFDLLVENAARIRRNISVPLSVDMERGYADTIPGILENIDRLCEAGVAGINIEDSMAGRKLRSTESFQKIVSAVANHLSRKNKQLFINVRTDTVLLKIPDAVEETMHRAKAYEAAGANGIFVPFIYNINDIKKVVAATSLPVHVLSMKELPDFNALAEAGVKRISMGSWVYRAMKRWMHQTIAAIQREQNFNSIF
jgi:2-methylisocitrate lyase-like PEP mutase family enzyme